MQPTATIIDDAFAYIFLLSFAMGADKCGRLPSSCLCRPGTFRTEWLKYAPFVAISFAIRRRIVFDGGSLTRLTDTGRRADCLTFPSDSGELSGDTEAIRELTLTARSTGHAVDRSHQREATSHLCAIRPAEVGH